jgi:hypothetical protein
VAASVMLSLWNGTSRVQAAAKPDPHSGDQAIMFRDMGTTILRGLRGRSQVGSQIPNGFGFISDRVTTCAKNNAQAVYRLQF